MLPPPPLAAQKAAAAGESSGPANDEGASVAVGETGRWYCGRRTLTPAQQPGTDGNCGPTNGPSCPACERFARAQERSARIATVPASGHVGITLGVNARTRALGGLSVVRVVEADGAFAAGVREGDILLSLDGQPVGDGKPGPVKGAIVRLLRADAKSGGAEDHEPVSAL